MKVLSIKEPWATLLVHGYKNIETRSWGTKQRGRILIHASKNMTRFEKEICKTPLFRETLQKCGINSPSDFHLGHIIGLATLSETKMIVKSSTNVPEQLRNAVMNPPSEPELSFGDYTPGRCAWIMTEQKTITPIEAKGSLGFWNYDYKEI